MEAQVLVLPNFKKFFVEKFGSSQVVIFLAKKDNHVAYLLQQQETW